MRSQSTTPVSLSTSISLDAVVDHDVILSSTPTPPQYIYEDRKSSTNSNSTDTSSTPTPPQPDIYSNLIVSHDKSQGVNGISTLELQPAVQRSLYLQSVTEAAPTSNINLENLLHRRFGVFSTWSHEIVMIWATRKMLDSAVVKILQDYHIDGQLLSTLTVHSLKEKCNIEDFRLRAKVIQAVEFLKDSQRVVFSRQPDHDQNEPTNDDFNQLPVYQRDESSGSSSSPG
ncbi:hypothetical protein HDU76_001915 [Blyttiomyces sp. JEL0837]|nr:hypothetical protein HDU76_001915 [Blyttiomyces sp. JEL0837]